MISLSVSHAVYVENADDIKRNMAEEQITLNCFSLIFPSSTLKLEKD